MRPSTFSFRKVDLRAIEPDARYQLTTTAAIPEGMMAA
jgi:hypothetical protein